MPMLPTHHYDTLYKLQSDDPHVTLHNAFDKYIGTHKIFSLRQAQFDKMFGHIILLSINVDVLSDE